MALCGASYVCHQDPDDVTKDLFAHHPKYLDQDKVKFSQVRWRAPAGEEAFWPKMTSEPSSDCSGSTFGRPSHPADQRCGRRRETARSSNARSAAAVVRASKWRGHQHEPAS